MRSQSKGMGVMLAAMALAALASLLLAGSASAKLTGEFTKFEFCPYKLPTEAKRCLNSQTTGGEVILGTKKVPIEKPVTLQGGYTAAPEEGPEASFAKFVAATNGVTLSKAAQNVPGGLLGIVPPEKSPALVKLLSAFFFENAITGVSSTLELAKPASEIRISEEHLGEGLGVVLKMPIMVHLENPFLGKSCYVGSSSSPIIWELRADTTSPPAPNKPITGNPGEPEFFEGGRILKLNGAVLVDNSWSAPAASGCGGIISFLVNPIINSQIGLPSTAGHNTAILKNTIYESSALAVRINNEEHP
jgi:hypothetical protein